MRGYKNFESDPHPGDLRHLVEIGYTENTVNENGYPEPNDVVVCRTCWRATPSGPGGETECPLKQTALTAS